MVALNPHQFGEARESTDYATGRRVVTYDIHHPDHVPVRSQAREVSNNSWIVDTTHGPFPEKDESGSYYKRQSSEDVNAPIGKVRAQVKRSAANSFRGLASGSG